MKKAPAILIDGNHLVRRSYYTVGRTLKADNNTYSGALFGSLKSLRRIVDDLGPMRVGVFFDGGHDEATKILPEYKSQKARDRPDIFYQQCDAFQRCCYCFGCHVFRVEGVEADSLIGIVSREIHHKYSTVFIVSSDHDLYQLIGKNVQVFDDLHKRQISDENFQEHFRGLKPIDMVGIKALAGDSSDNIPGLPNLGMKTACEVLRKIGGVRGLLKVLRSEIPFPVPEDYDKRIAWRIGKAFNDHGEACSIIKRNLKLVKIPTKRDQLTERQNTSFSRQMDYDPKPHLKGAQETMERFRLKTLLADFERWCKPIISRGGRL